MLASCFTCVAKELRDGYVLALVISSDLVTRDHSLFYLFGLISLTTGVKGDAENGIAFQCYIYALFIMKHVKKI